MVEFIKNFKKNWLNYTILILLIVMIFGSLGSGMIGNMGSSYQSKGLSMDSMNYESSRYMNNAGFAPEEEVRKITKNGNIRLESDSYDLAKENILKVSNDFSVIILSNNENKDGDDYRRLYLNVKVKADDIDSYLTKLKTFGDVDDFNIYSTDVTGSFKDYTDRIARYNSQLTNYVNILSSDLSVEDEIKIQQRIDQLEDQLFWLNQNYGDLEEKIVYSDVRITLNEEKSIIDEVGFVDFESGFKGFIESLGASLWVIIYVLGFVLPFALVYGVYRIGRKLF